MSYTCLKKLPMFLVFIRFDDRLAIFFFLYKRHKYIFLYITAENTHVTLSTSGSSALGPLDENVATFDEATWGLGPDHGRRRRDLGHRAGQSYTAGIRHIIIIYISLNERVADCE